MAADETVSMGFRVSPAFKAMLEIAAAQETRGRTTMLRTLGFAHCDLRGLSVPLDKVGQGKGVKQ